MDTKLQTDGCILFSRAVVHLAVNCSSNRVQEE
jgi:hypothetical protein